MKYISNEISKEMNEKIKNNTNFVKNGDYVENGENFRYVINNKEFSLINAKEPLYRHFFCLLDKYTT